MKEKTVEQIANQRQSGKTYLAMDEETKLKIEALYTCYNLNCHQIGDIVDWPWQSCSKHIKVVNDRIEYGKTTFEKLEAQGEQTIAKYGLDMYVNGIPEVPKEAPVIGPEQLAQEFPEIIQPTQEQTSTENEISVPPVEDTPKVEEKVSENGNGAESEFRAQKEPPAYANPKINFKPQTPEQWGKKFEASAIKEDTSEVDQLLDDMDDWNETPETRNETPVSQNEPADPERDRRVRKDAPFYLTLQNIIDRYEAGDIVFETMTLNESKGALYIEYASA